MKEFKRAIIQRKLEFLKNREERDKKIQNKAIALIKDNLTYCYQSLKDEVSTKEIVKLSNIIFTPNQKGEIPETKAKIIIIPARAFNEKGYRLGRGYGAYDRFLKTSEALKIGLAYDIQITNIPVEPHDQKVDLIITESRIIKCV